MQITRNDSDEAFKQIDFHAIRKRVFINIWFNSTYINLISLVANFQVSVDSSFVDVWNARHIRHAFIRCRWSNPTWNIKKWKSFNKHSLVSVLVVSFVFCASIGKVFNKKSHKRKLIKGSRLVAEISRNEINLNCSSFMLLHRITAEVNDIPRRNCAKKP